MRTFIDSVVGDRFWRIKVLQGGELSIASLVFSSETWYPGEIYEASCRSNQTHGDVSPSWGCECGIYAKKVHQAFSHAETFPNGFLLVAGKVRGWGKVVEHEEGYRFQYAYPASFEIVPNNKICARCWDKLDDILHKFKAHQISDCLARVCSECLYNFAPHPVFDMEEEDILEQLKRKYLQGE